MSDIDTTVTTPDKTGENQESTLTQAEVDRLINKKYAEWASRTADYEELKAKAAKYDEIQEQGKTELQKQTERADALQKQIDAMTKADSIRLTREKVAKEKGIPTELLTGEDEEACNAQADAIINYAGMQKSKPPIKDGGEILHQGGTATTRDMFAESFNEALGK